MQRQNARVHWLKALGVASVILMSLVISSVAQASLIRSSLRGHWNWEEPTVYRLLDRMRSSLERLILILGKTRGIMFSILSPSGLWGTTKRRRVLEGVFF